MIPILYEATEKEFTSQGLGCLTDTISCKVTEERNGSFELEMQYPIGGIHYEDIVYNRIITAVPADGEKPQPFEIYRITRPLNGKVTVYGQHISYRLSYTVTLPTTKVDNAADALQSLKSNSVTDCPFTFETDVVKAGSFYNPKVQSIRSILGGQTGSILDCFGGEYKWDKWTVKLCDSRGSTLPVTLEYGKNLTDLQQEENIENTYTAVICTWTSSDQDNPVHVNGDIVYTDNWKSFPYVRTLVVDKSSDYQNQPTKENLTNDAKNYISTNGVGIPKVSVKVSFINLADAEEYKHIAPLQHINLCDTIRVRFAKLGVNASAKVIKTVYDVLGEKYTSLEIGDSRTSLVSTTASVSQEIESAGKNLDASFRSLVKKQTDIITGGLGGYVVIRKDEENGYPDEILIMDQPDKDTAENVIRMNKNGIGFSLGKGYNGPFESAWTIDGVFNADFIQAGTLKGNLISGGILTDTKGNTTWNLDTGALSAKNISINSPKFKLSENGEITATSASLTDATIKSSAADGKTITISNGVITGSGGGEEVSLNIGDGLFNIIGKLALNGNVGTSGQGKYIKEIQYDDVQVFDGAFSPNTDDFVSSVSLKVSGGNLSADSYLTDGTSLQTRTIYFQNQYGSSDYETVVTGWFTRSGRPSITPVSVSHTESTKRAVTSLGTFGMRTYKLPTWIKTGTFYSEYGIISSWS